MNKIEPAGQPPEPAVERKPYNSPRIEESGQFEHLILGCGRNDTNPDEDCAADPFS